MIKEQIGKQHAEIKKALRELKEDIGCEDELRCNALWIALKIGHLSGILAMHLKFEDDFLYPCLLESNIAEARGVAETVVSEMSDLAKEFDAYTKKYLLNPNSIRLEPGDFRQETLRLIENITRRIEAEERDVYLPALGTSCFRPEAYKKEEV